MPNTIDELRLLQPNWDGYGSPAIDPRAIEAAVKILAAKPELFPCNGGVQVSFFVDGREYSITLKPDGDQEFDEPISRARLEAWLKARKWKRCGPDPGYWKDPNRGWGFSRLRDAVAIQLDRDEQAEKQEAQ